MASQSNPKHAPTTLTLVLLTRSRSGSCWPSLAQSMHLQPPQRSPAAKHSQYSFRQRDFLHEQMRFPPLLTCIMCSGVSESKAGVCGTGRLLDLLTDQIQRAVSSDTAASPERFESATPYERPRLQAWTSVTDSTQGIARGHSIFRRRTCWWAQSGVRQERCGQSPPLSPSCPRAARM